MAERQDEIPNCLEALDITLAILSTLDRPRDLLAAGSTSRALNRAVRENYLWQTVRSPPIHPSPALSHSTPLPFSWSPMRVSAVDGAYHPCACF